MRQLIISIFLLTTLVACSTSPTGRSQLKLIPAGQLNTMGLQAFEKMKDDQAVSKNNRTLKYVRCIANQMTPFVPKGIYQGEWEVVVFESEQVNAFALPGGRIGVYTGLLDVAKNQHQLAAVIGHEIGHVIAEHGNERMSSGLLINMGMQFTDQYLKTNDVGSRPKIMAALGLGAQVAIQLPFSRTHESEADQIGLELMAKAGFNPSQASKLWENMAENSSQSTPELLSTHPSPHTRIKRLNELAPDAMPVYQQAAKSQCG